MSDQMTGSALEYEYPYPSKNVGYEVPIGLSCRDNLAKMMGCMKEWNNDNKRMSAQLVSDE